MLVISAVSPAPRAISRAWPRRPKPVTSVTACTPARSLSSPPTLLSWVVEGDQGGIGPPRPGAPALKAALSTPTPSALVENQHVARLGRAVGQHLVRMDQAQGDEAVDRLDAVDGSGRPATGMPAAAQTDAPPSRIARIVFGRQLVDRHPDDGERQDRRPAHGVDVGKRVGRRDAPEVEGVVHHRHEEVGGRHQRLRVVQPPDRGVVGGVSVPTIRLEKAAVGRHALQDRLQDSRRQLAAAAAAVGEGGSDARARGWLPMDSLS